MIKQTHRWRMWLPRISLLPAVTLSIVSIAALSPIAFSAPDGPAYFHIEIVAFKQPRDFTNENVALDVIEPISTDPSGAYQALHTSSRRLSSVVNKLENSGDHTVLYHTAWRQAGVSRKSSPVFPIEQLVDGMSLQGQIRVHRARYLFMEVDLVLDDRSGERFQMKQTRRMRSEELHYFDHPNFGLLAIAYPLS